MSSIRWKWLLLDLVLPLLVTLGLTWFLVSENRDLAIQTRAFDAESVSWKTGELPFLKAVYGFGTIPAAVVAIAAVLIFVLGFGIPKLARYRRASAFVFLVAAVAAGIITNLILKENWGRPRPREVDLFGGRNAFEQVLTIDPTSDGKSFPCGHATMGFFFLAFYFLLRKAHPAWSVLALAVGLGFGILLGITRVLQGGHFPSDVVWAGAVTWFSAAGLFYLLRLNREVLDLQTGQEKRPPPLKIKLFGAFAILCGFAAIMLATPYSAKRDYTIISEVTPETELKISLNVVYGSLKIVDGDEFSIQGEAAGHGVLTSKIADRLDETIEDDGTLKVRYDQRWSGKLTEIDQRLVITIPWDRVRHFKLEVADVEAILELPDTTRNLKLDLITERAKVTGRLGSRAPVLAFYDLESMIKDETSGQISYFKSVPSKSHGYRLNWKRGPESELIFQPLDK
ncbi:MAG: phosphatase PAP2 family protein [Verrucomicrobiales bacterium]